MASHGHIWPIYGQNKKKCQKLAIYTAYIWPIYSRYTVYIRLITGICSKTRQAVPDSFIRCMLTSVPPNNFSGAREPDHPWAEWQGSPGCWPKFLEKNWPFFGHRWPFLVIDGPPLGLPGSVLTPSTCARPSLDRPSPDIDLFGAIFSPLQKNVIFWTPSDLIFTPLDLKIWPRE